MEHWNRIIEADDVRILARQCDADPDIIEKAIEEAEMQDIKPSIGDNVFMALTTDVKYRELLNGGTYMCNGEVHMFLGIRKALAYYAWARVVQNGANQVTRYGFVKKNEEYSNSTDYKERQDAYRSAFALADGYMADCLQYMRCNPDLFPHACRRTIKSNRTTFKTIGE